jgi:hypothetical protein
VDAPAGRRRRGAARRAARAAERRAAERVDPDAHRGAVRLRLQPARRPRRPALLRARRLLRRRRVRHRACDERLRRCRPAADADAAAGGCPRRPRRGRRRRLVRDAAQRHDLRDDHAGRGRTAALAGAAAQGLVRRRVRHLGDAHAGVGDRLRVHGRGLLPHADLGAGVAGPAPLPRQDTARAADAGAARKRPPPEVPRLRRPRRRAVGVCDLVDVRRCRGRPAGAQQRGGELRRLRCRRVGGSRAEQLHRRGRHLPRPRARRGADDLLRLRRLGRDTFLAALPGHALRAGDDVRAGRPDRPVQRCGASGGAARLAPRRVCVRPRRGRDAVRGGRRGLHRRDAAAPVFAGFPLARRDGRRLAWFVPVALLAAGASLGWAARRGVVSTAAQESDALAPLDGKQALS